MIDKAEHIRSILESMKASSDAYYTGAATIWSLLSSDEQTELVRILHLRPVWKGDGVGKESREKLLTYGLVTWTYYRGNEGYIIGTFAGYAAFKSAEKTSTHVSLPGDKR